MTSKPDDGELLYLARQAMDRAHSPYSKIRVGAAVLDEDGRVFSGCNVENASLGLTVCAERVALWNAVAGGAAQIETLVFVSNHPKVATPCGACRQVMIELAPKARVVYGDESGNRRVWDDPAALLPEAFDHEALT